MTSILNLFFAFLVQTTTQILPNCTIANYSQTVTTVVSGFYYPIGLAFDASNNLYVSDSSYHVYKYAPGVNASSGGVLVAPLNNLQGSSLSRLDSATALFIDQNSNNIYIADQNYGTRIQRWALNGATAGVTVAGANGGGPALNQITSSYGLYLDLNENLFVSDMSYHRVTKWVQNGLTGVLVAGSGVAGSNLTQLNSPQGIWVDSNGDLFVADTGNHRVVKWISGMTSGILVAGGQGPGSSALQLNRPSSVIADINGNLFVLDQGNRRIQQFTPGNTVGVTIFNGSLNNTFGTTVYSMAMDSLGNLYVTDYSGNRVQQISLVTASFCTGK
jgi:sugar lactone lactonase YvrE